ncbi:MAG: hypothetical protein HOQ09_05225 [Gemmatimonadaceae bacterium]|nr:hypothetical protein [Gemmatimonadaceae bacterium]
MKRFIHRFPTLAAAIVYAILIALIFWPFWQGKLLMWPGSDQVNGYSFRLFAATHFKTVGGFPLWNPYIFGGMPFLQNPTNGDTFYPTALLRLIMPVGSAMALGFMIHFVLAGAFTFKLLRTLGLRIESAFIGGLSYMLTGQILSQVSPGHDGKLFVSALTPLALAFLYRAVTTNAVRQYLYFGATVGFCLLTPHYQMTYYMLMAAGFLWIFLNFFDGEREGRAPWYTSLGLFAAALLVGFAVDAVQLLPFAQYIKYSPRGAATGVSTGYDFATSYSMPIEETLNVLWPSFSGSTPAGTYWGQNTIKLHSEYLGGVVMILATLGFFLRERRRLIWYFTFIALYALFFSYGGHTPLYHIPYALLPGIKLTRAPSQIFYLVSLSACVLAAFGVEYLLRPPTVTSARRGAVAAPARTPRTPLIVWGAVLLLGALLAISGGFGVMIDSLADPARLQAAGDGRGLLTWDALRILVLGGIAIGVIFASLRGRLRAGPVWISLAVLVALDLWSVEQRYIQWSPPASVTFAPDAVTKLVRADTGIFRVVGLSNEYQYNYLPTQGIRQVLGYQGTELHRYDELLGGQGSFQNLLNPSVLRLVTARYLILPQQLTANPAVALIGGGPVGTYTNGSAYLYRLTSSDPYAYLVGAAVKVPDQQALALISQPGTGFDPRRAVLVPEDAAFGVEPSAVRGLPMPDSTAVRVGRDEDDVITLDIAQPPRAPSFLFVSENYYPDWRATVDGKPGQVVRAQYSLIAIPVPAGARRVELRTVSSAYNVGRIITLLSLALVVAALAIGGFRRRRDAVV